MFDRVETTDENPKELKTICPNNLFHGVQKDGDLDEDYRGNIYDACQDDDRIQCLGSPIDIVANVDGFEILTPDPSDPEIGYPNRALTSLSYAVYRLFVSSRQLKCHWHGTQYFESILKQRQKHLGKDDFLIPSVETQHNACLFDPPLLIDKELKTISPEYDSHFVLWKRFSDFDVIQRYLVRRYPEIPILPPKTFKRNFGNTFISFP